MNIQTSSHGHMAVIGSLLSACPLRSCQSKFHSSSELVFSQCSPYSRLCPRHDRRVGPTSWTPSHMPVERRSYERHRTVLYNTIPAAAYSIRGTTMVWKSCRTCAWGRRKVAIGRAMRERAKTAFVPRRCASSTWFRHQLKLPNMSIQTSSHGHTILTLHNQNIQ